MCSLLGEHERPFPFRHLSSKNRGPKSPIFLLSSLSGYRSPEGLRLEVPLRSLRSDLCLTAASVREGTASQLGVPVSPSASWTPGSFQRKNWRAFKMIYPLSNGL